MNFLGTQPRTTQVPPYPVLLGDPDPLAPQRRQPRRPHPAGARADDEEVVVVGLGHRGLLISDPGAKKQGLNSLNRLK